MLQQPSALGARLEHEMNLSVLEVPNAAVDEPRRAARRSAGEIVLLHERDVQSAQRRLARDAASGDPAADHEQVELSGAERRESLAASRELTLHWVKGKPVSTHASPRHVGPPRSNRRRCPHAVRARGHGASKASARSSWASWPSPSSFSARAWKAGWSRPSSTGPSCPSVTAPNIAREVSLLPMLPRGCEAYTVSRACASANQAITDAADQILLGYHDVVIAGGAESLSNVPILHSRSMSDKLVALSRAKSTTAKLGIVSSIRPRDLVPITPAIAEPSTGRNDGAVGREDGEDQPHLARGAGPVRASLAPDGRRGHGGRSSHRRDLSGLRAAEVQRLARHATTAFAPTRRSTRSPRSSRCSTSATGSVTAGNSSPLTDGASAVLLMSEERARTLGYRPLAFIRSYAYAALDPGEQLLMAPVLAAPLALQRAGLTLPDMDLVEMHEAFAAQVLCNLAGFASHEWAERAGFADPVGEVDRAQAERDGRLDRDRTSVRRDRRAHPHDVGQRAGAARRTVRPDDGLRRRRAGPRDGRGARVTGPPTLTTELIDDVLVVTIDRRGRPGQHARPRPGRRVRERVPARR